ncbi:MAG: DUF2914 domain-containing protein [Proteobacteria bacterium]|nr:DUF2914 domain-containing protein [Pseudomonadota bacterium]
MDVRAGKQNHARHSSCRCVVLCASLVVAGLLSSACRDCSPSPCPPCRSHHACQESEKEISLSQLSPEALTKLRAEAAKEITDSMRARLRQEIAAELEASLRHPSTEGHASKGPGLSHDSETASDHYHRPMLPPTQEIERDGYDMKVLRQSFSTEINRRLPVNEGDVFSVRDAAVFCFAEIAYPHEDGRSITFKFTHSTGLSQSFTLPVSQSPAWRTWSKLNLTRSMTGHWLCEIFNEEGALLASKPFIVVD